MAEIINLKRARKARERAAKSDEAAANRAKFGRTTAEKSRAESEAEIVDTRLDAHRLDPPPDEPA